MNSVTILHCVFRETKMKFHQAFILFFIARFLFARAPVTENVRFEQRTDGSLLVDIYYDVSGQDGDSLEIVISASKDDGVSWTLPCESVSGDVGNGVIPGTDKHIIWDFYTDNPNLSGNYFKVRITAYGTIQDIDGNRYRVILIGDRTWMAENLRVTHYRNGDPVPEVILGAGWADLATGAYCVYDNNTGNIKPFGFLYNWFAVADDNHITPEGWHVPTDEEWKQLEMTLGMSREAADSTDFRGTDEGGQLKESGTGHWASPNAGATNATGFSALPGGYRKFDGSFHGMGTHASFWTASEDTTYTAWSRFLSSSTANCLRAWAANWVAAKE